MQNTAITIGDSLILGRSSSNPELQVPFAAFDHPAVSRTHARVFRQSSSVLIEDLGSTNGTLVNRRRIHRAVRLEPDDVVQVGPFRLAFDGTVLVRLSNASQATFRVSDVCRDVPIRGGRNERILDHINVEIRPGTLTCVIGASGSGKSTLVNIMAGRARPDHGVVALGSLELHAHFEALKQDIGYLEQSEIVHSVLSVRQALWYTARLRLPHETPAALLEQAVQEAVGNVGLTSRIDAKISSLSGGQRKRVCLAAEILSRPTVLFVDEATSGLDEPTDRDIMLLLHALTRQGMTIVCVTHTLAHLQETCDDLIVMARGRVAFQGPPSSALAHFSVMKLGDVLVESDRLHAPAAKAIEQPRAGEKARTRSTSKSISLPEGLHQFRLLTSRNVRVTFADPRSLMMATLQSVVIGGLIGFVFSETTLDAQFAAAHKALLLLLALSALWIGCNAASKEIVGERAIFRRESAVNLSSFWFLMSKLAVSAGLIVALTLLMIAAAWIFVSGLPGQTFFVIVILLFSGFCGVCLGLVISSLCHRSEQASVIVPLAVAPQLILGGGLVAQMPSLASMFANALTSVEHLRQLLEINASIVPSSEIPHLAILLVQCLVLVGIAWAFVARTSR